MKTYSRAVKPARTDFLAFAVGGGKALGLLTGFPRKDMVQYRCIDVFDCICTETPTYSNYAMLGWGFQVSCSRSRKHTRVQTFTFASLAKARRISQYRAFVSSGIASQYVSQIITSKFSNPSG